MDIAALLSMILYARRLVCFSLSQNKTEQYYETEISYGTQSVRPILFDRKIRTRNERYTGKPTKITEYGDWRVFEYYII